MNQQNDVPEQGIEEKLFEAWREERKFYDFRGAARFHNRELPLRRAKTAAQHTGRID